MPKSKPGCKDVLPSGELCGRVKSVKSNVYCMWHRISKMSPAEQDEAAARRVKDGREGIKLDGDSKCSACGYFVPAFYFGPGTRCKGCESHAKHASHINRTYEMPTTYEALYELQDGRCAVCRRRQVAKRLAVDHNHKTGAVRGLLCQWCNEQVLGSLGRTPEEQLQSAHNLVRYLETPPAEGEWSEPEEKKSPDVLKWHRGIIIERLPLEVVPDILDGFVGTGEPPIAPPF